MSNSISIPDEENINKRFDQDQDEIKKNFFQIRKNRKSFKCKQCKKTFKEFGAFNSHLVVHIGERQFLCTFEDCGKQFFTQERLARHFAKHNLEKPFKCLFENCIKSYSRLSRLQIHERTHTGQKPFKCPFENCNKSFNEKGNLRTHIRIHTGEKPFMCPFQGCGSSFKANGHLRDHIKIHTNHRPFICGTCGKTFSRKSVLKVHMRIHSGEKPYDCPLENCPRRFNEKSSLKIHINAHKKRKEFVKFNLENVTAKNEENEKSLLLPNEVAQKLGIVSNKNFDSIIKYDKLINASNDDEFGSNCNLNLNDDSINSKIIFNIKKNKKKKRLKFQLELKMENTVSHKNELICDENQIVNNIIKNTNIIITNSKKTDHENNIKLLNNKIKLDDFNTSDTNPSKPCPEISSNAKDTILSIFSQSSQQYISNNISNSVSNNVSNLRNISKFCQILKNQQQQTQQLQNENTMANNYNGLLNRINTTPLTLLRNEVNQTQNYNMNFINSQQAKIIYDRVLSTYNFLQFNDNTRVIYLQIVKEFVELITQSNEIPLIEINNLLLKFETIKSSLYNPGLFGFNFPFNNFLNFPFHILEPSPQYLMMLNDQIRSQTASISNNTGFYNYPLYQIPLNNVYNLNNSQIITQHIKDRADLTGKRNSNNNL